jgi:hypothetical protein
MPVQANFGASRCPQERRIVTLLQQDLAVDGYVAQNILMPDKEYPKMPNEHDIVLLVPWGAYSIESKRTEGVERLKLNGNNPDEWKRAKWLIGDDQGQWHRDPCNRRNARWTAWHKSQILHSFIRGVDRELSRLPVQGVVVFSDSTDIEASPNDSGVGGRWCKVETLIDLILQDRREYTGQLFDDRALRAVFEKLEGLPSEIGPGTTIHYSRLLGRRNEFLEIGCTIPVLCYDSVHELFEDPLETRIYDLTQLDRTNARFLVRMKRKLKALDRAEDPNVIRVRDIHEWMEGYLVSYEVFDGLALRSHMKDYSSGLPRRLAIQLALNVAGTVARLHGRRQPILHLDIRPENVLLARGWNSDGGKNHKLQGFTSARLNREEITPMQSLGAFGDSFVAPEIRQPSPDEIPDARQDIYSLGALLAYCLVGERAYNGALDERQVVRLATGDKNLDHVIRRAVAPDRLDRFRDAGEFVQVLGAQPI